MVNSWEEGVMVNITCIQVMAGSLALSSEVRG